MSEEQNQEQENPQSAALPVTIHAQYLRDLSFESPAAPQSLRAGQSAPQMNINFGMDARKIESEEFDHLYEVVLNVEAQARRNDEPVFIIECLYGVTVSVAKEVQESQHHPLLFIEIPRIAFPFVRQIIADATVNGGFPPLFLQPVDFHALYVQRFREEIEAAEAEALAQGQTKQ